MAPDFCAKSISNQPSSKHVEERWVPYRPLVFVYRIFESFKEARASPVESLELVRCLSDRFIQRTVADSHREQRKKLVASRRSPQPWCSDTRIFATISKASVPIVHPSPGA